MRSPVPGRDPAVTPSRVYLHVGAPKTGTTYLQGVLWHNRRALARDGVLYPADRKPDHFHAALDLRGASFMGYDNPAVPGSWDRVAAAARSWRGRAVVISHEMLAWAEETDARRAVESLRPAEVHVVYTARDLVRQIPAVWQESVKNQRSVPFRRFVRKLTRPAGEGAFGRVFWGAQDAVDVLDRWGAAVSAEHIHVVTVPPSGAPTQLLWQRFASVLGLDPGRYDTDVARPNTSLGLAEVELLRKLNDALAQRLPWPAYEAVVKRGLAETVLAARPDPIQLTLPAQRYAWARQRCEQLVAGLRSRGYDVAGDLADLVPPPVSPVPEEGSARDSVEDSTVLAAAVDALAALLVERAERLPDPSARALSARAAVQAGLRHLQDRVPGQAPSSPELRR